MTFSEFWSLKWTWVRSFIVGSVVGIIPAAGAAVASFIGYGIEQQTSKHPEKFGTGVPEGIAAPECANNASTGGAMIPLLTLGIPGSAATAVMLGVFLVQGIQPGPSIFINMPDTVFLIFAGGIIVNAIMFLLGRLMIVPMVKLMDIPKPIMAAFILVFSVFGAFSLRSNMLDVWVMIASGIVSYIMRRYNYPTAPLILGLILGPMAEDKFMTSMYAHHNDFTVFFTRPISGSLMVFALLLLFVPFIRRYFEKRQGKKLM
jgi:putative tricarboxylic transport membrane protein